MSEDNNINTFNNNINEIDINVNNINEDYRIDNIDNINDIKYKEIYKNNSKDWNKNASIIIRIRPKNKMEKDYERVNKIIDDN